MINCIEFLKEMKNLKLGQAVINGLTESMVFLEYILADMDLGDEYCYEKYKDLILNLYEIDNFEDFRKFFNTIRPLHTIKSYEVIVNTIKEYDNTIFFDVKLKGRCEVILSIKMIYLNEDDVIANLFLV